MSITTYLAICPRVKIDDPRLREGYSRKLCSSCGKEVWFGRIELLNPCSSILCRECIHDPA